MTGTEKSTARPSPQSGFEIELIPYPDCIEVQTLKVTSLDNGTCFCVRPRMCALLPRSDRRPLLHPRLPTVDHPDGLHPEGAT